MTTPDAEPLAPTHVLFYEAFNDGQRREPGEATPVGMALRLVQSEVDEIAKATFGSITLTTMLRLVERQPSAAKRSAFRKQDR